MNHIVDTCPLTKFVGGLNLLLEVDDDDDGWNLQRLQHSRNNSNYTQSASAVVKQSSQTLS